MLAGRIIARLVTCDYGVALLNRQANLLSDDGWINSKSGLLGVVHDSSVILFLLLSHPVFSLVLITRKMSFTQNRLQISVACGLDTRGMNPWYWFLETDIDREA